MPDVYFHELNAYSTLAAEFKAQLETDFSDVPNLTWFSLNLSNKIHLGVCGLCALVEWKLFEIAKHVEKLTDKEIPKEGRDGLEKTKKYLFDQGVLDFGKMPSWAKLSSMMKIRNALIHCYGDLEFATGGAKVEKALSSLGWETSIQNRRKIRLSIGQYQNAIEIARQTIEEIDRQLSESATFTPPP